MRVAVISDIHSNLPALEMVVEKIKSLGVESVHCLGDIVGYGADPGECIAIIRDLCDIVIAGNHDWGAVGKTDLSKFNKSARAALEWTAGQLDYNESQYLTSLPLIEDTGSFCLVHGTPANPQNWDYLNYKSMLPGQFAAFESRVCFIGHSHKPVIWSDYGEMITADFSGKFEFGVKKRYIVNIGSVGQPRNGDPRSCFVVYDDEKGEFEYIRTNYDVDRAANNIKKNGLPDNLASRLYRGF